MLRVMGQREGGRGVVSYGAERGREGCCELWGRGREGGVL